MQLIHAGPDGQPCRLGLLPPETVRVAWGAETRVFPAGTRVVLQGPTWEGAVITLPGERG